MAVELHNREAVVEYFRNQVRAAMSNQGLLINELTEWYIVQLLSSLARGGEKTDRLWVRRREKDGTMAQRLGQALNLLEGSRKAKALQEIGDHCLMISGFWQEQLKSSLVGVDYYISMGQLTFGVLGQKKDGVLVEQFVEISSKFLQLVEVLAEVAEASQLVVVDNANLLQIYERYLHTGSPRLANFLKENGLPIPSSGRRRRVQ